MRRIAVTGCRGMLGQAVLEMLQENKFAAPLPSPVVTKLDRASVDITDSPAVAAALTLACPEVIINCAAYTNVEGCEQEEDLATKVNGAGVANLAAWARENNALLIQVSTDFVFDGQASNPYPTDAPRQPLSAYGRSKLAGELALEASGCRYCLVRTAWLFGAGGANFVTTMLRLAREHGRLAVVADQVGTPTYTTDLAAALVTLAKNQTEGVFHCTNAGATSWQGFASEIVKMAGLAVPVEKLTTMEATEKFKLQAIRPAYSVLDLGTLEDALGEPMRSWEDALAEFIKMTRP